MMYRPLWYQAEERLGGLCYKDKYLTRTYLTILCMHHVDPLNDNPFLDDAGYCLDRPPADESCVTDQARRYGVFVARFAARARESKYLWFDWPVTHTG